jgi:hypothetical protein
MERSLRELGSQSEIQPNERIALSGQFSHIKVHMRDALKRTSESTFSDGEMSRQCSSLELTVSLVAERRRPRQRIQGK